MKIYKHTANGFSYFQCEPTKGVQLFAFTKRALLRDLFKIYSHVVVKPFNLN